MDPQSSFRAMANDFPVVVIDIDGAGDYVAKCDVRIAYVKRTYRATKHGLPWSLPKSKVRDLMAYVVSRLNVRRANVLTGNVSPKVLFCGVKVDYKKEFCLAFGDYIEAYEGTTNTSKARSSACIALYPTADSTGAWMLWKIDTNA